MDSERQPEAEAATRRLVGSWAHRTAPVERGPGTVTGLGVPPSSAEEVIAAARHLAAEGRPAHPRVEPARELRLLAEAMVVDEHPSAGEWTAAERRDALDWITLLIHRFGEDGVQRLVDALNARR